MLLEKLAWLAGRISRARARLADAIEAKDTKAQQYHGAIVHVALKNFQMYHNRQKHLKEN